MTEFFRDKELANKLPIKRAAYSDRTAWILAEISNLVYEPLPNEKTITSFMEDIIKIVNDKGGADNDSVLKELILNYLANEEKPNSNIEDILSTAGFKYINSYAKGGSEALLCQLNIKESDESMLVVAFRGTQPKINDVLTDLKLSLEPAEGGGRLHEGFNEAFYKISNDIKDDLKKYPNIPIYMTGHSLGGALAVIATKYLSSDSLGATYTYGAPRIGDTEFFKDVKTPVYRVVNAGDAVPRVPLGPVFNFLTRLLRLVPINGTKKIIDWLEVKFKGYIHYGNMIFLDAPKNINDSNDVGFKDLNVYKSPSIFIVAPVVINRYISTFGKAAGLDHKLSGYCNKLYAYAKRRSS